MKYSYIFLHSVFQLLLIVTFFHFVFPFSFHLDVYFNVFSFYVLWFTSNYYNFPYRSLQFFVFSILFSIYELSCWTIFKNTEVT